jgi:hypothetical protein
MKSYKDVVQQLDEVLTKSTPAGTWIKDFVDSDNPKFAGKSPAKRKQMALAAYYAKKNESVEESAAASQNSVATQMDEDHLVHVNDGSKYDEQPHEKDVEHVMHGAKKHGGENAGLTDKGVLFKFKNHSDAHNFISHVNKCPHRSCDAHMTESVDYDKPTYLRNNPKEPTKKSSWTGFNTDVPAYKRKEQAELEKKRLNKEEVVNEDVDKEAIRKEYKKNESDNRHTENAELLAKHFGSKRDQNQVAKAKAYRDKHNGYGGDILGRHHSNLAHEIHKKLYDKLHEEVNEAKVYDPFTKKMVATKPIKVQAGGGATRNGVPVEGGPSKYKTLGDAYRAATAGQTVTPKQKLKNEEVEQIDELSKDTLASYAKKASHDARIKQHVAADFKSKEAHARNPRKKETWGSIAKKYQSQAWKREKGHDKAVDKLKEDLELIAKHEVKADAPHKSGGHVILTKSSDKWHVLHNKKSSPAAKDLHSSKLLHSYDNEKEARAKFKELHEEQIDELNKSTLQSYRDKAAKDVDRAYDIHQNPYKKTAKDDMRKLSNRVKGDERAERSLKESEQIDELDKKTIGSYAKKATKDLKWQQTMRPFDTKRISNREKGIDKAIDKLAKEEVQIDELSKGLVARYANKAAKTTQANYDKSKDKFQFSSGRQDGMKNAVKRLTKEEAEQIDESSLHRQHFQMVADLIRGHESAEKRKELAHHHAELFKKANPRFDHAKFMKAAGVNEEVQIDEISKSTLARYIPSAARDVGSHTYAGKEHGEWANHYTRAGDWSAAEKHSKSAHTSFKKANKRIAGIDAATKKLATQKEEVQVDEATHQVYDTKTHKVHSTHDTYKKAVNAMNKLNKEHPGYDTPGGLEQGKFGAKTVNEATQGDKEHAAFVKSMASYRLKQAEKSGKKMSQAWYDKQVAKKNTTIPESRGHKIIATFLKNRETAQKAFNTPSKNPIDAPIATPEKDANQKKKMMGMKEAFMSKNIEADLDNLSSDEYVTKYGKSKSFHRRLFNRKVEEDNMPKDEKWTEFDSKKHSTKGAK